MMRLHWLLRSHPDAVEADLDRFFGIDLLDYWRGHITTRKLLVRVRHIPEGQGAAIRSLDGPEWTTTHDLLDVIRRNYASVHRPQASDPIPGPHPASPEARRTVQRSEQRGPLLEAAKERARARRRELEGG